MTIWISRVLLFITLLGLSAWVQGADSGYPENRITVERFKVDSALVTLQGADPFYPDSGDILVREFIIPGMGGINTLFFRMDQYGHVVVRGRRVVLVDREGRHKDLEIGVIDLESEKLISEVEAWKSGEKTAVRPRYKVILDPDLKIKGKFKIGLPHLTRKCVRSKGKFFECRTDRVVNRSIRLKFYEGKDRLPRVTLRARLRFRQSVNTNRKGSADRPELAFFGEDRYRDGNRLSDAYAPFEDGLDSDQGAKKGKNPGALFIHQLKFH